MKKSILLLLISFLAISCNRDDDGTVFVTVAEPITILKADSRAKVEVQPSKSIKESGKFYFYRDYIFVNEQGEGVHVIDNHDPVNPQKIAFINIPGNYDVEVKNGILYADSYTDLVLFDLGNMTDIKFVKRYDDVIGNRNYPLPEVDQAVWSADISSVDLENEVIVGWSYKKIKRAVGLDYVNDAEMLTSSTKGAGVGGSFARFKIVGSDLYIVDQSSLYQFDISSGDEAVLKDDQQVGWQIETIFNQGDYLYLGSSNGMFIYDIAGAKPEFQSMVSHILGCDPVVVDGDYAYLTIRGGNTCAQAIDVLEVYDVSDKKDPQLVKTFDMQEPYGLGIKGDKLFVSDGPNGLHVYDRTDPVNLDLLNVMKDINIYDVIPLNDKLLMVGDNTLRQYSYKDDGLEEISSYTLK